MKAAVDAARQVATEQTAMNAIWLFARVKLAAEAEGEGSSHGARVSALTLAARLLGLLKDKVDVTTKGKSLDQLTLFRARYGENHPDDA